MSSLPDLLSSLQSSLRLLPGLAALPPAFRCSSLLAELAASPPARMELRLCGRPASGDPALDAQLTSLRLSFALSALARAAPPCVESDACPCDAWQASLTCGHVGALAACFLADASSFRTVVQEGALSAWAAGGCAGASSSSSGAARSSSAGGSLAAIRSGSAGGSLAAAPGIDSCEGEEASQSIGARAAAAAAPVHPPVAGADAFLKAMAQFGGVGLSAVDWKQQGKRGRGGRGGASRGGSGAVKRGGAAAGGAGSGAGSSLQGEGAAKKRPRGA